MAETAKKLNCDRHSVQKILKENKIESFSSKQVNLIKYGQTINQFDLNGQYIQSFPSIKAAAAFLNKKGVSHISDVCKGKRKTAYGYIWKYAE